VVPRGAEPGRRGRDYPRGQASRLGDVGLAGCDPDDRSRGHARRVLQIDRRLWTAHPASIASCLLARTLGADGFAAVHHAFCRELDERGSPWVRPLRALPVAAGLLAELHEAEGFGLHELGVLSFESDDELVLAPYPLHPNVQAPARPAPLVVVERGGADRAGSARRGAAAARSLPAHRDRRLGPGVLGPPGRHRPRRRHALVIT